MNNNHRICVNILHIAMVILCLFCACVICDDVCVVQLYLEVLPEDKTQWINKTKALRDQYEKIKEMVRRTHTHTHTHTLCLGSLDGWLPLSWAERCGVLYCCTVSRVCPLLLKVTWWGPGQPTGGVLLGNRGVNSCWIDNTRGWPYDPWNPNLSHQQVDNNNLQLHHIFTAKNV